VPPKFSALCIYYKSQWFWTYSFIIVVKTFGVKYPEYDAFH